MSNKYFDSANNPNRVLPYEVARAEQINNTDDLIEQGMALVEADVTRAIKLPIGTTTDQVLTSTAAQRQNSLLAFDASGNVSLTGTDLAERLGKVLGWDGDGNIYLYDYAAGIHSPSQSAISSAAAALVSEQNAHSYSEQTLIALQSASNNLFNDDVVSALYGWSSQKLNDQFVQVNQAVVDAVAAIPKPNSRIFFAMGA